jgi:hypothetical protein
LNTDLYSRIDMLWRVKVHAVKKLPTGSPMEVVKSYVTVMLKDTESAKYECGVDLVLGI